MLDIGQGQGTRVAVVYDEVAEVHRPRPEKIAVVDAGNECFARQFVARVDIVSAHECIVGCRCRVPSPGPVPVQFEFSRGMNGAAPANVAWRRYIGIELINAGSVDVIFPRPRALAPYRPR